METEYTPFGLAKKAIETIAEHAHFHFADYDGSEIAISTHKDDVSVRCYENIDTRQWRVKVGFRGAKSKITSAERVYSNFYDEEAKELMALIEPHLKEAKEKRLAIMQNAIEREEIAKEGYAAVKTKEAADAKYNKFTHRDDEDDDY